MAFLQLSCKLEGVGRYHPVVVIGSSDHCGGVFHTRLQVVQRRVRLQVIEILGVICGAVFWNPALAHREFVVAQHIHYAHSREGNCEQVRPLGHGSAYQQTTIGTTRDGQFFLGSVPFLDQVFSSRDEVIEDVLLLEQHPGLVPFFTVFTPTAQVGHGVYTSVFEQNQTRGAKAWSQTDVEPTVTIEVSWVFTIQFEAFFVDHKHGYLGAVLAGVKNLFFFVILRIELQGCFEKLLRFSRFEVVFEDDAGVNEGSEGIKGETVLFFAVKTTSRTYSGQFDFLFVFAVVVHLIVAGGGVLQVISKELFAHRAGTLQQVL